MKYKLFPLTAIKFRFVLATLMTVMVIVTVSVFVFGYRYMQSVGEDTAKRQADAVASEDSIGNLQRLQIQLQNLKGINEKLSSLRSSNTLPQFDTERSLRTITSQLGLGIRDVTFLESTPPAASTGTTPTAPTTSTNNAKISFQFDQSLSYNELIRFLEAVETSTPKLTVDGISLPDGSTRASINPGTLTIELATD